MALHPYGVAEDRSAEHPCLAPDSSSWMTVSPGDTSGYSTDPGSGFLESQLDLFPPLRFGDYRLLEEIARGGMGVVYRAQQINLDRTVALKMVRDGPKTNAEVAKRFLREVRLAAALDHPHIVPIHDAGQVGNWLYFTMPYVEGGNLSKRVCASRPPALA